ncbi:hypothetical protein M3N64_12645 [Sporolactobacillus sp. CPB3-1]|uniref:Uncharacterized protein n=1 Tax=Sporolactobacillus mangiferae TaxID=2940498 RepID=A0ABT0MD17_9BACL|nr:hypothetical protein [Sporolactobacillus mangiferae]MCL1632769.1 hypothetical protein [Sporolactobacillus mangiferae]
MLSIGLYISYFLMLALYLTAIQMQWNSVAVLLIYALIIFPSVIPFLIIIVDQRKEEQKKAKQTEEENRR